MKPSYTTIDLLSDVARRKPDAPALYYEDRGITTPSNIRYLYPCSPVSRSLNTSAWR